MLIKSILAIGLAAFASNATIALAIAEAPKSEAAKDAKEADGKRYCIKMEANTGSRMAKTLCKTRAQWEDEGVEVKTAAN